MKALTHRAFDNVAVTGTNTYYGQESSIERIANLSYHLVWDSTITGTFTVWVSNVEAPILTTDADWVQLTLATAITQPAGASGKDWVDLSWVPARWIRVKYVNASGSANIWAYAVGKDRS